MGTGELIFIVLLAVIAGSYGWAMRGTILGGERGSALPGAILGLLFAYASGSAVIWNNFWILATLGGCAMMFGGAHTYGETIDMTKEHNEFKVRMKGRIGLLIKGANWFAIFAGIVGTGLTAMTGRYKVWELCLLVVLIPVAKSLGILCLNMPQKPAEGKFPPIYFSYKRFETWGGLAFIWIEFLIFALVKKDWFTVIMIAFGFIGGGLGFFIGNMLQTGSSRQLKNGRYLFGKLQKAGLVSSWKVMEFTLGAAGGLATVLCFCIAFPKTGYAQLIDANGIWNPISELGKGFNLNFTYIWLAMLVIHLFIYTLSTDIFKIIGIKSRLRNKEITSGAAEEMIADIRKNHSPFARKMGRLSDITMEIVYMLVPILLMFMGNATLAKVASLAIVHCVLAEEVLFSFRKKFKHHKLIGLVMFAMIAVVIVLQLTGIFTNTAFVTWIYYCLFYEIVEVMLVIASMKKGNFSSKKEAILNMESGLTVRIFSFIEIVVMVIMGCKLI